MDDATTIQAVLTGDKQRYSELIERYKRMVYAIAWSRLSDAELAEDASQETFVRAYQYLATLRQRSHFDAWLGRIARNVSTSLGKKRVRERNVAHELAQLSATTGDESSHRHDALWSCLAELPATHREALTLFYVQGKSITEAAEHLGIAEPAMKVRLHRARLALRQRLETSLEESLTELEPSKRFTGSVMALLPVSPIGVVNTAGFYAVLAKLGASLSFLLFMAAIQIAATGGIFWLTRRMMQSEYKDTPENQFRHKASMRPMVWVLIIMSVVMFPLVGSIPYLMARFGIDSIFKALSFVYIFAVILLARRFRINRSVETWLVTSNVVVLFCATAAIGYLHAPTWIIFVAMVAMMVLLSAASRANPPRNDYNLFLRAATDGFGACGNTAEMPPRLSDFQLREFALFLGNQSLIADYKVRGDGMSLWLMKIEFPGFYGIHNTNSFDVAIDRGGLVSAKITPRLASTIEKVTGRSVDPATLNASVSQAVSDTLRCFVNGNREVASTILTVKPNSAVFTPKQGRAMKILATIACVPIILALVMQFVANKHLSPKDKVGIDDPSTVSGMPFNGSSFFGGHYSSEAFFPAYPSEPLWLKTTLRVDPRVDHVEITGLKTNERYTISATPETVSIAPGGSIAPTHGMIRVTRTATGFVVDQQ